jgi:hypothetical protein
MCLEGTSTVVCTTDACSFMFSDAIQSHAVHKRCCVDCTVKQALCQQLACTLAVLATVPATAVHCEVYSNRGVLTALRHLKGDH